MAERALNSILEDINTQIKTVSFGGKITTRGLCYLQEKDEKTFPMENVNTRDAKKIVWNDTYPLQTYHRILSTENESDPTQGFGNKSSRTKVYQMRLVGIGKKASLSAAAYEDNQEIAKTIEAVLPPFINTNEYLNVDSMEVIKQNVYDEEFAGVEIKKYSLEGIAFWIDYTLKITGCESSTNLDNSSTVRNTDDSYSTSVNCKQTLTIPDITITKLDDSTITYPAAKDLDISDIDNCDAPTTWAELVALIGRGYNYPQSTDQTTSYRTGDDANIEATVFTAAVRAANSLKAHNSLANFTTLNNTNSFGNTNRFTDDAGGQTYANDYVIDHYTGFGWYMITQSASNWNAAIDNSLSSTQNSFSDWFLANMKQLETIISLQYLDSIGGYAPFSSYTFGIGEMFTSSTVVTTTTSAFTVNPQTDGTSNYNVARRSKSSSYKYLLCRKHY